MHNIPDAIIDSNTFPVKTKNIVENAASEPIIGNNIFFILI